MTRQFYPIEIDELCELSRKLTKCELVLYIYLQTKSWKQTKTVHLNLKVIASELGFSKSAVAKALKVLINHGLVKNELFPIQNIQYSVKTKGVSYTKRAWRKFHERGVDSTSVACIPQETRTRFDQVPVPTDMTGSCDPIDINIYNIDLIDQTDSIPFNNSTEEKKENFKFKREKNGNGIITADRKFNELLLNAKQAHSKISIKDIKRASVPLATVIKAYAQDKYIDAWLNQDLLLKVHEEIYDV